MDVKEEVWLKLPALPHPLTEGAGELVLKRRKLLVPNVPLSSSLSSSDEAGLKVLENDLGGIGTRGGGNIRAQFLGNVSTVAWMMPAKQHQSECFTHTGHTHSSPIMCHTLIWNWNAVLRVFVIKGPCAWVGMCLWRVDFMLDRNASMAFSAWAWATLQVTCNRQTTGSSKSSP